LPSMMMPTWVPLYAGGATIVRFICR
jgi:hypothetical protein